MGMKRGLGDAPPGTQVAARSGGLGCGPSLCVCGERPVADEAAGAAGRRHCSASDAPAAEVLRAGGGGVPVCAHRKRRWVVQVVGTRGLEVVGEEEVLDLSRKDTFGLWSEWP